MTSATSAADAALFEPIWRRPIDHYRIIAVNDVNVFEVPEHVAGNPAYAVILQDRRFVEFRYGMRFFPSMNHVNEWSRRINEGGDDFAYVEFDGPVDRFTDIVDLTDLFRDCWTKYRAMTIATPEAPIP